MGRRGPTTKRAAPTAAAATGMIHRGRTTAGPGRPATSQTVAKSITEAQVLPCQDVALADASPFGGGDVPLHHVADRDEIGAARRGDPQPSLRGLDEHRALGAVDVARPDDDRRIDRHGRKARVDRAAQLTFGEVLAVSVQESARRQVELVGLGEQLPGCRYAHCGERAGQDKPFHTGLQGSVQHVAGPPDVRAVEALIPPAVAPVGGDRRGVENPIAAGHRGGERVNAIQHVTETGFTGQAVECGHRRAWPPQHAHTDPAVDQGGNQVRSHEPGSPGHERQHADQNR